MTKTIALTAAVSLATLVVVIMINKAQVKKGKKSFFA
jgi:hypothetical protein